MKMEQNDACKFLSEVALCHLLDMFLSDFTLKRSTGHGYYVFCFITNVLQYTQQVNMQPVPHFCQFLKWWQIILVEGPLTLVQILTLYSSS